MNDTTYENLIELLSPNTLELFSELAAAHLGSTGDRRFLLTPSFSDTRLVFTGPSNQNFNQVDTGALDELVARGLLREKRSDKGTTSYAVTAEGERFFTWSKQRSSAAIDQGKAEVQSAADTWTTVALPILRWCAEHPDAGKLDPSESMPNIDQATISREIGQLYDAAYLTGTRTWGADLLRPRLTESGLRAVGAWPKSDPDRTSEVPLSAHQLPLARVKRIDPDKLSDLVRRLEPFIAATTMLLDEDTFTEEDTAHVEHALRGLHQELWQNPGDPSPLVVAAYSSALFETVGPYLPASTSDAGGDGGQPTDDHARKAVGHAANIGTEEPEAASTEAANSADELSAMTAAADADATDGSLDEPTQRNAARSVYESLGWLGPPTAQATVGVSIGVTVLPQVIQGFSPIWAAVIGAVIGVLAHLFRVLR